MVAEQTGGKAYYNSNDLTAGNHRCDERGFELLHAGLLHHQH
jgi:hypothetical protein